MDDLLFKILAGIALMVMLIFDWSRAVAGAVLGLTARNFGRPWLVIPASVIAIPGLSELVYAALGFRDASKFLLGLITASVTSLAVVFGLDGFDTRGPAS